MSERCCILCVDDDVSGHEAWAALLEEEGYFVTAVSCPLRALEFGATKFHLAVLDFAMPALNGFQLLLHLRAAHASSPIVLLSGMSRALPNEMRLMFLKLPRHRRTDTYFAEDHTFLSRSDLQSASTAFGGTSP